MGRKNSVFSHRRLFESSCYKTIDNMPPNSTSQEPLASSAPKFKKNSEDAFEPSKKITERGSISNRFLLKGGHSKVIDSMLSDVTSQESASKDKKRPRDASETRKKRKDKGYKSSRVLSNDGSPVPIGYMHTKQLPQENTSEKDKTESQNSNSLIQTRPQ